MDVVVSIKQEEVFRIPIVNIESILTFGYMGASPGLMKLCVDNNVSLAFLTPQGRFIGRIQGKTSGNVLLRRKQYDLSRDNDFSLNLSKLFISGKVQNYRSILRRFIRDYGENPNVEYAANIQDRCKHLILNSKDSNQVRGYEGDAANAYFSVFPHLILANKDDFKFQGRNRRPPKDPVNAMLSFAYTLLANDVASALESVGLDPSVGFLHTVRPGRNSLALDMMEELRAYMGDRFVLSLINRKQMLKCDFIQQGEFGVTMTDSAKKTFISAWQTRKKETITHPFLGEKISLGLLPYSQAMLLARYIRGDINDYPVFLIK